MPSFIKSRNPARGWLLWVALAIFFTACQPAPVNGVPVEPTGLGTAPAAAQATSLPPAASLLPSETPTREPTLTSSPTLTSTPTLAPTDTPTPARPAAFPLPEAYTWQPVASGLNSPVGMAHAGDGSNRLFILEQPGRIRIWQDGSLLAEPFLDLSNKLSCCGERGLLGLAFHPQYVDNGYFYVNYTDLQGNTVISRFQAPDPAGSRADPASERQVLFVEQPFRNHNGGSVIFGPDGYLYLGLGDGESGGDPLGAGQSLRTLLGKVLRLDVNTGEPYGIPAGNPFADGGGRAEIWAFGLRNPWRMSFDRQTGDLYIADVGQNSVEEINFVPADAAAGINFGWNYREGSRRYQSDPPDGVTLTDPVAEYEHPLGCSVTGGYVYRGGALPEWQGIYMYGDYCSGRIWGLLQAVDGWQSAELFRTDANITSFGEDENGELYLVDYNGGVYRLAAKP